MSDDIHDFKKIIDQFLAFLFEFKIGLGQFQVFSTIT